MRHVHKMQKQKEKTNNNNNNKKKNKKLVGKCHSYNAMNEIVRARNKKLKLCKKKHTKIHNNAH